MPHKRAALVIIVVASGCVLLAGCGGGSGSPGGSAAGPVKTAPSNPSTSGPKLTGNFCTDFKNIGQSVKLPAAKGSPSTLQQQGVQYLAHAATYFNGLAQEAPVQAGKELRLIAGDYQAIAESVYRNDMDSLSKIEKQMQSLTSNGAAGDAFRQMVTYVTTKCMSSA